MYLKYENTFRRAFLYNLRFLIAINFFIGYATYQQIHIRQAYEVILTYIIIHMCYLFLLLDSWKLNNLYIKDNNLLARENVRQSVTPIKDIIGIECNAKTVVGKRMYVDYKRPTGKKDTLLLSSHVDLPKTLIAKFLADITKINPNIKLSKDCEKWKQEYLANDTKALARY